MLDRLHQEFERQKRFAGDASHQLRTPLAALLGQLEVARRRERSVEEYRRVLDEVHGEAVRLRQIVESLLFMARAESEAGTPELEPVELVLWVRERLACRPGGERAADLHAKIHDRGAGVGAGAAAASGPGARQPAGQRLQVQPRRARRSRWKSGGRESLSLWPCKTRVWESPPRIVAHVFEPFYRSVKSRRRPGVGLGLAVVERIAAVFGGTIRGRKRARPGKPVCPPASRCDAVDRLGERTCPCPSAVI